MRICDNLPTDPPGLHFEPLRLHFKHPRLHLEPRKLMYFDINEGPDPDPALHCNADPDLSSKNKADPRGSGSETLTGGEVP
jgi:hypothetical protein